GGALRGVAGSPSDALQRQFMDTALKRRGLECAESGAGEVDVNRAPCSVNRRAGIFFLIVLLCTVHGARITFAYLPGKFYPPMHVAPKKRTLEKVIALTFDDGPGRFTIP